jgi:hypothetical protein
VALKQTSTTNCLVSEASNHSYTDALPPLELATVLPRQHIITSSNFISDLDNWLSTVRKLTVNMLIVECCHFLGYRAV